MSPRTPEQFEEMRIVRRRQIMDAALELFAKEGYNHCSISQLAKHAGISKGLLYNYFEGKEALLTALIDDGLQTVMDMIDPNHDGAFDQEEVEGFIRKTFKSIREHTRFWTFFISVILQPRVKELLNGEPFTSIMENFAPKLIEYFKQMGYEDPYLEMLTFSAFIEGYGVILVYYLPKDEIPDELIQKLEDRMVDMFTKKKG